MTDQLLERVEGIGSEARSDMKRAEESLMVDNFRTDDVVRIHLDQFLRDAIQLLNQRIEDLTVQQRDVLTT